MAPAQPSSRKLTYDDFLLFPDDGQRHELIEGEHYVTPSPTTRHQQLSVRLTVALANHIEAYPGPSVFHAPLDCVFTTFDIVEPDILVITSDQQDIVTEQNVRGAPALVVEILSPGTRRVDLGVKLRLYDRVGVREYWVVDSIGNHVEVHRRTEQGRLERAALSDSDTLTTPLLPGFSLDLGTFFE